MSTQAPEKHAFQAEVQQVLDIVIHSLYTDKEIFIRELVSNAADSLEKLRHLQLTEKDTFDEGLDLEINLTTDETAGTLTIQDFGVGLTREELVENLGTIAHSGSKAFVEALKDAPDAEAKANLIGRFGVGFYSAFMAAEEVTVYTHSWKKDGEHLVWKSSGAGEYSIEATEGQRRGAKIVLKLKEEAKEFAKADRVKAVLQRYSNFVPYPITLNGERVNTVEALWMKNKSEVSEEQYKEFYKFTAGGFDDPRYTFHFAADAPIALNALLFVPEMNTEKMGLMRFEPAVALHCRKVLIDAKPEGLLPDWLRFLKGVVDSADLPLNISRESMQDSALVKKIGSLLTKRFLKFLGDKAKSDPEKYKAFLGEFGHFLKEGVATDFAQREALAPLLRWQSSTLEAGELTGLGDYVSRMKDGQEQIYYLVGESREALEAGPYLEAFRARGLEVLLGTEGIDAFVFEHLGEYKEKKLVSAESKDIELEDVGAEGEPLPDDEMGALSTFVKETLGERVSEVSAGKRLVESPAAVLTDAMSGSASMRRMMRAMNRESGASAPVHFELNPRHALVHKLAGLHKSDAETAKLVTEQLFDGALLSAGLLEDTRGLNARIHKLLEKVTGA